ncbi:hypothetical protein HCN44_004932 [Aphidius gifuensis]|uniref:Small ribosomal subunit protein mS29 n=1 Tax=Aphidius gifuensis TaxID=684658 RepID=A0A834XU76_APHGI|nr:28S ribosomal protein S29, mitochondrial [Aphidius gifuensis]KAF7992588.1 hypothetical protein HCN44_004932 [Aphidius gifuensis]
MMSTQNLLRRGGLGLLRRYTTIAEPAAVQDIQIDHFRTNETNPINHDKKHLNRFYKLPNQVRQKLFQHGGLPQNLLSQFDTFFENCILIREPALEIISYLKATDYSRPVNRYVLYGENGTGKTLTMAHVMHYGLETKKIIIHTGWIPDWFRRPKEIVLSTKKQGFYDLPVDAAAFLVHFKHQNSELLAELDLRLSKDYEWSSREQNPKGSPLIDLIDLGITRIKFSCDIVDAVVDELKILSSKGQCSCLVFIDGFNSLFGTSTELRVENRKLVYPYQVTLTDTLLKLTKYDWSNGAVILTLDKLAVDRKAAESHYPHYLLGKEGFEHLDPFLPIQVNDYSNEEFENVMDYYRDRKWIRNVTENGQKELELVSNKNPYLLMKFTGPL